MKWSEGEVVYWNWCLWTMISGFSTEAEIPKFESYPVNPKQTSLPAMLSGHIPFDAAGPPRRGTWAGKSPEMPSTLEGADVPQGARCRCVA